MTYQLTEMANIIIKPTNTSSQLISTSFITLNGSEVFYTPHKNSTKVLYEYNFGYIWQPDVNGIMEIDIQNNINGSWNSLGTEWRRLAPSTSSSSCNNNFNGIYILDPWEGSRGLRIRGKSHNANHESTAHITRNYHQSYSSKPIFPVLKIYSLI